MERHFPIKSGQPIEMAVVVLNFDTEFPNKGKEPVCQKWKGEFPSEYSDWNMWTRFRGDPEYSGQKKPKWTLPFERRLRRDRDIGRKAVLSDIKTAFIRVPPP